MFVNGENIKKRIEMISQEVLKHTNQKVYFEEYIALPYDGWIVLRFNLNQENVTIADLDLYENLLYDIVGDEFIIDFMGDVYQNVGLDLKNLDKIFEACYAKFEEETIQPSRYGKEIQKDIELLLKKGQLDPNLNVWEIQIEENELNILIMGERFKEVTSYPYENNTINIYEVKKIPCIGCMRAVIHAKRNHLSVVNVLLSIEK